MEHTATPRLQAAVAKHLAGQVDLTPKTADKLKGVLLPAWGTDGAKMYMEHRGASVAFYNRGTHDIALHPAWSVGNNRQKMIDGVLQSQASGWMTPTAGPLEGILAHEYGHHVARQFTNEGGDLDRATAERLLPGLARALGVDGSPVLGHTDGVTEKELDKWVRSNGSHIRTQVSGYGRTSFGEMLGEIWAEYSTMGDQARPHIREIGDLMRELAEGSHQ